jgi:energy-converting hydrogenase Eha subunit E
MFKKLTKNISINLQEYYTLSLITVGLPLIGLVYSGWKLALTIFILTQITIGLLYLRATGIK